MFKKIFTVALFASTLAACKSTPPPADVSLTNIPSVSYKLPLDQSIKINFDTYNKCVSSYQGRCDKYEKIKFVRKTGEVIVEKKTHNGLVGSGAVYTINEKTERTADSSIVTYQPVKKSSYKQGLILPFAVPNMDITSYLSNIQFKTKFEINSDYPSQSVKANFDRLMKKAHRGFRYHGSTSTTSKLALEDSYMVDVEGVQVVMLVESFPYRNGSKVVVNAVVQTRKSNSGVIDVTTIMKRIEEKVTEVINS